MTYKQLIVLYRTKLNKTLTYLHNALTVLMETLGMDAEEFRVYAIKELNIPEKVYDELITY